MSENRLKLIQGVVESNEDSDVTRLTLASKVVGGEEKEMLRSEAVERRLQHATEELVVWIKRRAQESQAFFYFERGLIPLVFRIGCWATLLYLTLREEALQAGFQHRVQQYKRWFTKQEPKRRILTIFFGQVAYFRTYYYSEEKEGKNSKGVGFHPLDHELGLSSDAFSLHVVSLAARLAAMMPYAAAAQLLQLFIGGNPSQTAIEHMVLGLGTHTQDYFTQAFPPRGDGEILVIMIDCKAVPTATAGELRKRRGKRKPKLKWSSARHQGRHNRKGWQQKSRRKKGDKRKNGRAATLVVMYTLKASPEEGLLCGPINKRVFASFAPKRFAFAYARREAEKRGFAPGSNHLIQFVSDGDRDFRIYLEEYFSEYADHEFMQTIDLMHVMEYVWEAGHAQFTAGSDALATWAQKQKKRLLESRADLVLVDLRRFLEQVPKTGPGNKSKRERIEDAIRYLESNLDRMDYRYYRDSDLELASGAVEGAVKYVIGFRLDNGGMRWIVERAEAILQLRCIMINGQWDDFIAWYHEQLQQRLKQSPRQQILRDKPHPLPSVEKPAQKAAA